MKPLSADVLQHRTLLAVAVTATVASGLIGLVDAIHPLPVAFVFVRAGLGMILGVVLLALLVRWLGAWQRQHGGPPGRLASLTLRQQWLLTAILSVVICATLIAAGFVTAVLARS